MRRTGDNREVRSAGEAYTTFVPYPLPPDPQLELTADDLALLSEADRQLGRLDGMASSLPDSWLFIYFYVRREAIVSSQIEGTQSSLSELLLFEALDPPDTELLEVHQVSNYVEALNHGLQRLNELPLSLRLIRELHEHLLRGTRGSDKRPGEFRTTQNWVGGSRPGNALFVPPPPDALMDCLSDFERFMHADDPPLPPLIKAGLLHVQFETIHPFLDGNGRVGRLLIILFLCAKGVLQHPLLYLSLYLKENRQTYYDLLQRVRLEGVWEEWLRFFLTGVIETAKSGVSTAARLKELELRHETQLRSLGRFANSALLLHRALLQRPIADVTRLAELSGLSVPTVTSSLRRLEELGLVEEISGRQWRRIYRYREYLTILQEGTEPLLDES